MKRHSYIKSVFMHCARKYGTLCFRPPLTMNGRVPHGLVRFMRGEWKEGTDIRFIGPDGSGTLASLLEIRKYDYLLAKYIALLLPGGVENRTSEAAKGWIGMTESYTFLEKDGVTELVIDIEAYPAWEKYLTTGMPG